MTAERPTGVYRMAIAGIALASVVVVLGAYTRLVDAGLGCPDWPGCYGQLGVPTGAAEIARAEAAFPRRAGRGRQGLGGDDPPLCRDNPGRVDPGHPGSCREESAALASPGGACRPRDRPRGVRGLDGHAQALAAGRDGAPARRVRDVGSARRTCARPRSTGAAAPGRSFPQTVGDVCARGPRRPSGLGRLADIQLRRPGLPGLPHLPRRVAAGDGLPARASMSRRPSVRTILAG